jgi:hypothetical protein
MRHRRDPMLTLNPVDNPQGLFARAPPGAVGDRAEIWIELVQGRNRLFQQCALSRFRLGGKEFEGEHGTALHPRVLEDVAYMLDQGG